MKSFGNLENIPNRNKYKTDTGWLRAVYRNNKDFIDSRSGNFKTFKTSVNDYVKEGDANTVRQGLQMLSRSSAAGYQSRNELQQSLIENAMQGKKTAFKKATGERFDQSKLHYNSKTKEWDYVTDSGEIKAHFADIRKTGYRAGQAKYRTD